MNLLAEELLTLEQAGKTIPVPDGKPQTNRSTIWRWALRGKGGIRLETVKVGGKTFTSAQAVHRFIAAINEPAGAC